MTPEEIAALPNRLLEAVTVLDEPFHRGEICKCLEEAAAALRQLLEERAIHDKNWNDAKVAEWPQLIELQSLREELELMREDRDRENRLLRSRWRLYVDGLEFC